MPQRPTDAYWRERVRSIGENEPRLGPRPIVQRLEREAEKLDPGKRAEVGPPPSERTISRILAEHRQAKPEERRPYRYMYWPSSFEHGDLPWEASAACLELLRERKLLGHGRPPIRLAKWFYWVTLAVPQLDFSRRYELASLMSAYDGGLLANTDIPDDVEAWLAFGLQPDLYALLEGRALVDLEAARLWTEYFAHFGEGGEQ